MTLYSIYWLVAAVLFIIAIQASIIPAFRMAKRWDRARRSRSQRRVWR